MLKLYNTLSRKKENFKPISNTVKIYSCGPTVYSHQHIGNLRTYIFNDLLIRVLKYNKYKLKQIINVTDVGHLTNDANDTGSDKIEKAAKKEGKKAKDIANYYLKIFKQDFKKLNIGNPSKWTKATEHIKEQINMIKILEKKGYTYKTDDGIYFDTSKLKDYGKLSNLKVEKLKAGLRTSMRDKKNTTDFALWKFSLNQKRQQEWKSPFGKGYPGWHIECSAMASKYLGKQFDIHTGGEDLIQIHHTNEIAQSEAAFGKKPWVKYWLHGAFLTFNGEKVSKSKGGLYTITELEEKNFDPLSYRYLCLTTNYHKPLSFSLEGLEGAQNSYNNLKSKITELKVKDKTKTNKTKLLKYEKEFNNEINDNLNIPKALSILWLLLKNPKINSKDKLKLALKFDKVLGLNLDLIKTEKIPKNIQKLAKQREKARKDKNWKESDKLRNKINKLGYTIEDTPNGHKITTK